MNQYNEKEGLEERLFSQQAELERLSKEKTEAVTKS